MRQRHRIEPLEPRTLFAATTVFADGFEGNFLSGWTNRTGVGANASTRWGVNTVRASAGSHSAFGAALAGGVTAAEGYQNSQNNTLVRENVSLAGFKLATLTFDYFLNSEAGYDTFSVAIFDGSTGTRTTLFSESGNFALAGFREKTINLDAFAGKSDLDLEFRFESDASVINEGGGVWLDDVNLTADTAIQPGSISGKLFDDSNNNKTRDAGEAVLPNWTVYLDQNRNGVRDSGEASKLTDASGNYSFTNLVPGTYYVAEQVASGFEQTSPGSSGRSSGSWFKIDVDFPDSSLTAGQRAAFSDAANRWAQIIVGDLPDVNDNGTLIDDVRITATAPSIDGRGGILGQAAATGFRAGTTLPFKGFMEFDAQDLAQLEADGQLTRVILHEMGHVLGFGTIWGSVGVLQGVGSTDPRFLGSSAAAQYNAVFGTSGSSVPVEASGGPGTAESHWRETSMGNELMTGYLNVGFNPISAITVGAMADLGYSVSYNAADAYSKSSALFGSLLAGPMPYLGGHNEGAMSLKEVKGVDYYGEIVGRTETTPASIVVGTGSGTSKVEEATLLPFAHTVFVGTGEAIAGLDFGNRRLNKPPVLTTLTDSPDPVTAGGNITLTATGASDPDGSVTKVSFYREANGTAGLQTGAGGDALVGTDSTSSDGFKATVSTSGLAAALYTYYAQATDNTGLTSSAGTGAATRTNTVTAPAATGSISGTVFRDTNGNGVKDTGESGQSGWRVYIDANKNSAFDSSEKNVVTGTSGTYSFTGLAAGTYNVREVDQTSWNRTNSSPIVTIASGAAATGKNFANFQNASIAGKVFNDSDRDGVLDSNESGLANVRVYDDKNGNGVFDSSERSTTTNSTGNYTLSSLAAGQRTIRIVLPSGRSLTSPSGSYHRLTPTSGQAVTGKNFGTRTVSSLVAGELLETV